MAMIHNDLLEIFKKTYPELNIGDVISYDDQYGTFLDLDGNRVDRRFLKYTPTNFLGGITPSSFIQDGTDINTAIAKALSFTSLKTVPGVDYNVPGNVSFKGGLEQRVVVKFSADSSVFTGEFVVRFYNIARSGFNALTPRDFPGAHVVSDNMRLQALCLSHVFTADVATMNGSYLSATWINEICAQAKAIGLTTDFRSLLVGNMMEKIYSDTYSDLVDINIGDFILTLRFEGTKVKQPFIKHIALPVR